MNILNQILNEKKIEVSQLNTSQLKNNNIKQLSFLEKLSDQKLKLIAEVKQASPSKGIIYQNFNPIELATSFESHGASCISVLTDQKFFKGHRDYLVNVKKHTSIPVLRKDFIIDLIQVDETKDMGADVMLLILDILSIDQANELIDKADQMNIEVLIEIHSEKALEKLKDIKNKPLVGVNNRDLTTFTCDTNRSIQMSKDIRTLDPTIKVIAESGYSVPIEMEELENHHINGVLIGEGLSKNKSLLEWFKNEN